MKKKKKVDQFKKTKQNLELLSELAKTNELLERGFSSIDLMIAHMDRDFNFIRVNRAYAEADKQEPEFYIGQNHFVLFPNKENEGLFRSVVETGESIFFYEKPFEYPEHPERGVTYWDWSLQPIKDTDGKVSEVILSLVNVTERKKAQEAQRRLTNILEATSDFVAMADLEGRVLYCNKAARQMLGIGEDEDISQLKISDTHPQWANDMVLEGGIPIAIRQGIWSGETAFLGRDGREIPVSQIILAHKSPEGNLEFLSTIARDITERKKIEDNIHATNTLLRLLTPKTTRKGYLDALVNLICDWSKCRCVGIRVRNEQGFIPYESYIGFSADFWKSENWLSIDQDQCACIRVVKGELAPQDASIMTSAGSFHCNNTLKFVANLPDREQARYRGVCVEEGFMTVAVIPIRYRDEMIGAIHLADERQGRAPSSVVEFLETLTPLIGEAIHRFNLESELHRNYETQKAINSLLRLSLENIPLEEFLERTLDMMISIPMISLEGKGCIFIAEPDSNVLVMKAQYGLPDSIKKRCARVSFGACLCGRTALTKQIQYTDYLNDCHDFPIEGIPPHSHYHVPILFGNRLLGLITLYLKEEDRPSHEKEGFLTAVANTLASIILRKEWEVALRESESRLRLLSDQLLTAQENERKQIARDLHDGVGQMLSAIKFKIEDIIQLTEKGEGSHEAKSLGHLVPLIRESIEEVRRIQMDIRPSILDDLGIIATVGWFTREFGKVYSAVSIQKQIDLQENEVPVPLKIVIYRIIQEALNNIAKHSRANRATIALRKKEGIIELTVEDDGAGFDLENHPNGFGLGSMRERIELSGGLFLVESAPGRGTTINASWPRQI